MNIRHLFIKLIILINISSVIAQAEPENDPFKVPEILPKSPESASLGSYGAIPVSEYSGTPNISIPLHTVKVGNIEMPINLSYNSSGIKVDQEATYVGLGWNLIAGGSIGYNPVGSDERVMYPIPYSPVSSWSEWEEAINFIWVQNSCYDYFCGDAMSRNDILLNDLDEQVFLDGTTWGDGEQDIFSVNCLGYSFKFILHPDSHDPIFVGEKNKCRIIPNENGFLIIGEDGIKYFFNAEEINQDLGRPDIWYLTRIEDLNNNWIELDYNNFGFIYPNLTLNEQAIAHRYNTPSGPATEMFDKQRTFNSNNRTIKNLYLTEIRTPTERVSFILDDERLDINGPGARKLTDLFVIDSINEDTVIHYSFNYDYFQGSESVGGNYLNDRGEDEVNYHPPSMDNLKKRLKLTSLSKINPNSITDSTETYNFSYNETYQLPLKTSFAKDYWGYYNGQENESEAISNANHTLIPDAKIQSLILSEYAEIPTDFLILDGANRGMSLTYATTAMLNSITYPTGGKTIFEFEPHEFSNKLYLSAEDINAIDLPCYPLDIYDYNSPLEGDGQISDPVDEFTLYQTEVVIVDGHIDGTNCIGDMTNAFIQIRGIDPENSNIIVPLPYDPNGDIRQEWQDYPIELEPGNYLFECDLPETVSRVSEQLPPPIRATLEYKTYNTTILDSVRSIGGGLRIKTITNYSETNTIASVKKYSYIDSDGTSSGLHLIPLSNYFAEGYQNAETRTVEELGVIKTYIINFHQGIAHKLSNNNYQPLAISEIGTNVGYSRVEVEDLASGTNNGKEIIYFENATPVVAFNRWFYINQTNGNIQKRIIENRDADLVREEIFSYSKTDIGEQQINAHFRDIYIGPEVFDFSGDQTIDFPRFSVSIYKNHNFFNQLESKNVIDYYNGGTVSQLTEYVYDLENYGVDELKISTSKEVPKYKRYKYPHDFEAAGNIYNTMINEEYNRINPVIEVSEYNGDVLTQKVKTNYSASVINPENVEVQIGSNPSEIRMYYDKYDVTNGHLLQYHKSDDISVSFLWGYNNTYPVAKIVGASYNEYNEITDGTMTLFSGEISNLTDFSGSESDYILALDLIRQRLKNAMVTTYTYKPLIGLSSITDPKGMTTTYKYDDFGRLKTILDKDLHIIKEYEYHYQGDE